MSFMIAKKGMRAKNTLLLAVLSAVIAFAASARAEVITKGGASLLTPKRAPSVEQNKPVMSCAKCTSDYYVGEVRAPKGSRPETVLIEKHRCEGCATRIETRGFGKAKTDVAVHTCSTCNTKTCCVASAK